MDTGRSLPTGTVTFLLTDVEGSTRLWHERATDMATAIARHYEILDASVRVHGGVRPVEQGEGDSIVAAFSLASDAVAAAVDAQRALVAELPWLGVRMAVHTGEALLRDEGNYVGVTIIRCARLRAVGHGRQILISETTAPLVLDAVPEVELVDLGVGRLRDLSRPERVWQAVHRHLPAAFPPLLSLDELPNNLPVPLTSFIGRDEELAAVAALMGSHRLVTIAGSGGCGKTRLALEAAASLVDRHRGGTWWVALAPLTDGELVPEAMAGAVGLSVTAGSDVVGQLVRRLSRAHDTLVVIDNAEHVLDAVARLVEAVLSGSSTTRIVITSREPLGVAGECLWRLPSLASPPAREATTVEELARYGASRLFLDRARQARPNLLLDDEAVAAVAAICRRLDGIPLALELAAARTRALSLERLAAGLDDAFRLLTRGSRTALPRQQTLLASIEWSADLLDEVHAAVLRRLAVLRAPFTIDAAEQVAADGRLVDAFGVLDAVTALVDKSLVQLDEDTGRYRMLETIRQFGLNQLTERGELSDTLRRHATWCTLWAEEVGAGKHGMAGSHWSPTMPDVLAATEWAMVEEPDLVFRMTRGLGWARVAVGYWNSMDRLTTWVCDQQPGEDRRLWAAAVAGLCPSAVALQRSDVFAAAGTALTDLDGDPAGARLARLGPALSEFWLTGNGVALLDLAEETIASQDVLAYPHIVGSAISPHLRHGHLDDAHAMAEHLRAMLARHGLQPTCDHAMAGHWLMIELATTEGRLHDALQLVGIEEPFDVTMVFVTAAATAQLALALDDAELMARADRWADREPPPLMSLVATSTKAYSRLRQRRYDEAALGLLAAWEGTPFLRAVTTHLAPFLMTALLGAGRTDDADRYLQALHDTVERTGNHPLQEAEARLAATMSHFAAGRIDTAAEAAHRVVELAHGHGYPLFRIDGLEHLARIAAARQQEAVAARLAAAAIAARSSIGHAGRIAPDAADYERLCDELARRHTDAWSEGLTLDMNDTVAYVQRARGVRGRPKFGWDALTPTERQVARLAAAGSTNNEIATSLIMSPATVKTHLGRVFTKLDVTNRTKLSAVMAADLVARDSNSTLSSTLD